MSMFNTRVVRRSNALLGRAWGTRLFYKEAWWAGTGLSGRARAYGLALATKLPCKTGVCPTRALAER